MIFPILKQVSQGPSYSIDTIHHLSDQYQPDNITLVVGFDQLYQFHQWRSYEEILQKCRLLVILRRGIDHERLMSYFPKELVPFKQSIRIHEMYPTAISSSRLRIMIQRHQPINDYVPEAVRLIIQQIKYNYLMGKKIVLVVGATGLVGAEFVKNLQRDQQIDEVRCIVRPHVMHY